MEPHVHIGFTSLALPVLATVAVLGTLHLLALTADNRPARALIALGF